MPRERLAKVLHRVDPNLRIVEGRPWPGKKRTKMSQTDWEKGAGVNCNGCDKEVFRTTDGLCGYCYNQKVDNEIEIRDKAGAVSTLIPLEAIMEIVHPARKEP